MTLVTGMHCSHQTVLNTSTIFSQKEHVEWSTSSDKQS